jgi:hypothetical protein
MVQSPFDALAKAAGPIRWLPGARSSALSAKAFNGMDLDAASNRLNDAGARIPRQRIFGAA